MYYTIYRIPHCTQLSYTLWVVTHRQQVDYNQSNCIYVVTPLAPRCAMHLLVVESVSLVSLPQLRL